jgi:hypothetical protein
MIKQIFNRTAKILASTVALWIAAIAWAQSADNLLTNRAIQGPHEFFFTRGIYTDNSSDYSGGRRWAIDWPKADEQFMVAVRRLSNIDAYDKDHPIKLDDPNLRRFPFLYILEVGDMRMTDEELEGLRNYLLAGGFLVIDDFWGSWAWANLEKEMARLFPGRAMLDISLEHPVFNIFYNITEILQVPNVRQGEWSVYGGPTHEYDGYVPYVRGIFDDAGRLMVLINWNTDLGDAWEWADDPHYPLKFSTYAFEIGINFIVYAMTY